MQAMVFAAVLALALAVPVAVAHSGKSGEGAKPEVDYAKAQEMPFGKPGDPRRAKRTVTVDMSDKMRFMPAVVTVKQGDIVRFVVKNRGQVMHEMVLGTMRALEEHAALMRKHPDMEHDEPYMAHVAPGRTGEIGWQFTRPGEFFYACLVPGHFEAGMVGKVIVQ